MTAEQLRAEVSVMSHSFARYSFKYYLDSMEKYGLAHVDLTGCYPHFFPPDMDGERIKQVKAEIYGRGMDIVCYNPENLGYPYNIASIDPELRKVSCDYLIKNVQIASELEAPLMMTCAGWGSLDESREEAFKCAAQSLYNIACEGEKLGVRIALEHLTVQSSNLLNYSWQVKQMLELVRHNSLGVLLDLGQMSVFGERPKDFFNIMEDRIFHIHIMDGDPYCHLAFGDGILPLKDYWEEVRECGYKGLFSLEINDGRYAAAPYEAHKKCVDAMKEW